MTSITKSIAFIILSCTLIACEKEPEGKTASTSKKDAKKVVPQAKKKLSVFELEIQKMLDGEKGDEVILREFLKGKPKKKNVGYVKQGLDYYLTKHGKRPNKEPLIDTLLRLNRINVEMRNEEVLDEIKQKLSDQLKRERGQ